MSLTRNCGGLGRAVSSSSVRMRLICSASCLASLITERAGLFGGRSRLTISMTPAIPARGLRISCAKSGGQLAQGGEVLGARHLGLVQALDFLAARLQLRHHVVEVAAQFADFVVAIGEAHGDIQVAGRTRAILSCNSSMGRRT